MSTINQRIAECIKLTGLTQVAFAKRINLSQPHISKITLGESSPSDRTIADICREFSINENWLRTGEGNMIAKKSREHEIAAFIGGVLSGEPDFRRRFITVLSRMSAEEWNLLEKKITEIANEP